MIEIGVNQDDRLVVRFSYDKELVELMHELPSRSFNKKTKLWEIPLLDLPILRDTLEPYVLRHRAKIVLTEGARRRYLQALEFQKGLTILSQLTDVEYATVGLRPGVNLYPFQKVGATYLEQAKRALLAFDMGLGKTITAIAATGRLMEQGKVKKPLIICPASLKYSWAIELAKFSNYSYTIIDGEAKSRKKRYRNNSDFTIVNYDLLRHDIDEINAVEWDLAIADEIQRAKNYTTAISRNIRTIQPEYIFGLTGTPIENELMDLFTIMRFINPAMFGANGMYFKDRYFEKNKFGGILNYRDNRNHEIDRKTSFFMIRRKKRDVLSDLPEKIVKFYHISLSAEERAVYNRYKAQVANNFEDVDLSTIVEGNTSANVLTQVVYLREICDCINLVEPQEDIVSSKLNELKNILTDIPMENKVVIFTEYERMAKIIEENVPYQSVHLHGGIENGCRLEKEIEKRIKKENKDLEGRDLDLKIHEAKQEAQCKNCPYFNDINMCNTRKKIISKFNDDPNVRLFISTNAGKEGLNLQVAPVVINYDMSFNPAVNEQRIARIDRIGQESDKILVINLVCHDTIEEKILKILEEKQDLFDKIIDKIDKSDKDILRKLTVDDLVNLM